MDRIERIRALVTRATRAIAWLPPLLARLTLAAVFAHSGWYKFGHLAQITRFFESLHVPAPAFQVRFVATNELVCGLLLLVGLATRLAALPLIGVMLVALLTAKWSEIHTLWDLAGTAEFVNIVLLVWLVVEGAGALSLDARIAKRADGTTTA